MVGCCGGGGQGRIQSKGAGAVGGWHDEEVCHGTGERRQELLDQLKIFLNEFDDRPCQATPRGSDAAVRPLGDYAEYRKKHCQSWAPAQPRPPLITSVQAHETRPVQDYERMRHENTEYVSYTDARIKPPPATCDCAKRNGLQDQCPRPECTPPTPQCLASNPGPCCPPSMGLTRQEAAMGQKSGAKYGAGAPRGGAQCGVGAPGGGAQYGACTPGGGAQYGAGAPGGGAQYGTGAQYRAGAPVGGAQYGKGAPVGGAQYGAGNPGGGAQCGTGAQYRAGAPVGGAQYGTGAPGGGAQCGTGAQYRAGAPVDGAQYGQIAPMICFCQESPSSLPKDKKYLCCPAPM